MSSDVHRYTAPADDTMIPRLRTWFAALLIGAGALAWPLAAARDDGLENRLYVANDAEHRLDIYDVDSGHKLLRSITPRLHGRDLLDSRCRGIAAHAASRRLFFTDSDQSNVVAMDLSSEKVVWERRLEKSECEHPDRLSVTVDGRALYVPCKLSDSMLVLDASTGATLKTHTVDKGEAPHNTYAGERGEFMYLGSYRSPVFRVYDQRTHEEVRRFGGFSSGIRPFAIDPTETYLFTNLTTLLGFGVGDVRAGRKLYEVEQRTPAERLAHPEASGGHPHGGQPKSHGLALRPGTNEVWFLDDEWGYKRLSHNFLANAAYTFGKSFEDASMQAGSGQSVQNYNDILADRGRTSNDRRHQFKASVVWTTNYFDGGNPFARALLDGWTVSGIVRLRSGRPLTITAGRDANGDGNSNDRADVVPGVDPTLDPDRPRDEVIQEWFNTEAFAEPANLTDGNSPRNFIDGPGSKVIDVGLYRDFPLGGGRKLQLRMEATNAFNFVNLDNPTTNVRSGSFGEIDEAGPMRRIQLGARFSF